jgi:hypothetical protein
MRYLTLLILLVSTVTPAQDTAKFYLIAIDGSYSVAVDGVRMKVEGKHYIEEQVLPGRHALGYQIGYFGDWTATSLKVMPRQDYYFIFVSAPGSGRTWLQLSSNQGELCLRAIESRSGTEQCLTGGVNLNYPSLKPAMPGNLMPSGLQTLHPR